MVKEQRQRSTVEEFLLRKVFGYHMQRGVGLLPYYNPVIVSHCFATLEVFAKKITCVYSM